VCAGQRVVGLGDSERTRCAESACRTCLALTLQGGVADGPTSMHYASEMINLQVVSADRIVCSVSSHGLFFATYRLWPGLILRRRAWRGEPVGARIRESCRSDGCARRACFHCDVVLDSLTCFNPEAIHGGLEHARRSTRLAVHANTSLSPRSIHNV